MKHSISRNIAIVSALFLITFSVMLITNYFQVSNSQPIQSELIENLKQANETLGSNPQLQEQIRELDLLARKAYFISLGRLKTGVTILLVMAALLLGSLQLYFAQSKNIPEKEIDPIDEWLIKSKTRRYTVWMAGLLLIGALIFASLSTPYLKNTINQQIVAEEEVISIEEIDSAPEMAAFEEITSIPIVAASSEEIASESPIDPVQISTVTHNALRGDHSLGFSLATDLPTSWNLTSGASIRWSAKVPRKGFNSPVINGNKVFFSGGDKEAKELFCYDLSSGEQLWKLEAKDIPGSPGSAFQSTDDTGYAAPSVATNGKQVCAIFSTGDVICSNMDGKQLWVKNVGVPDINYGYASSLLIYDNLLIIQYDTHNSPKVMALDLATGNERWVKERPERNSSWSSPIVATVNNQPQLILIGNPGISS